MRNIRLFQLIALFVALPFFSYAQYISPGNNLSLSLDDLVNSSSGVVTQVEGAYHINGAFTLSATDTLRINQAAVVRIASGIRPQIDGTIISDPLSGLVYFTAIDTTSASTNYKGFRFDESPSNVFRNTVFSYGGGLQLISSDALFEYCSFRKNGSSNVSAVITYSSCSPVIRYCSFIENARSAIGSGANVSGSPQIMYSVFIHNTTDNSNRPQINLGPGAEDSLYIVGNYMEGMYTKAGAIGLSNLLATGSTKAVVRDNYIVNNRYGYAQIGNNISGFVTDNYFIDNNIENEPNLGGSGMNFQASGAGNTAIVKRNVCTGNLWGVTIQGTANPQFGTEDDLGENVFYDNGNSGNIYALYNNTALDVTAVGNYWGTNDPDEAEEYIFHQPDQGSLGYVTYLPIKTLEPRIQFFMFSASENQQLITDIYATINHDEQSITAILPAGTDLTALIPQIGLDLGVISDPPGGEPTDFSSAVEYTVVTPHGESAVYTATIIVEELSFSLTFTILGIDNQPVTDAVVTLNGTSHPEGVYHFEDLLPGTYSYSITHAEYNDYEGSVEITDQSVELTIQLIPLSYTVSFTVVDEENTPIPDAVITFNGNTHNAGVYVFENILPGTYLYEVNKTGYASLSGQLTVSNQHITENVVLVRLRYTLTFDVKDQDNSPLQGVVVSIEGIGNQTTDDNGIAVFDDLFPDTYNWQAEKQNYELENGAVIISDEDITINLTMQLINSLDELLSGLRIYPVPAIDYLYIETDLFEEIKLSVWDNQGRMLLKPICFRSNYSIPTSSLPSGKYLIRLVVDDKEQVFSFIKQ